MARGILIRQDSPISSNAIKELNDKITALQSIQFYVDIVGEGAGGISVTAQNGNYAVSGTTDCNGKCVLKANMLGNYSITYNTKLTNATQTVVADSYGLYNISAIMPQQVGYLMLYNKGDECLATTGGWRRYYDGNGILTKKVNHLEIKVSGENTGLPVGISQKIDLAPYAEFKAKIAYEQTVVGNENDCAYIGTYETQSWQAHKRAIHSKNFNGIASLDVSDINENMYIGVGASTYDGTSILLCYAAFLLKFDDWQTWLVKAGVNPFNYVDLEAVLDDSSAMTILGNSTTAINYMVDCTGTIMGGILGNDTAFNAMSTVAKQKMAANPHWSKFAAIYGRTLI